MKIPPLSALSREGERLRSPMPGTPETSDVVYLDPAVTVGAAIRAACRGTDDDDFSVLVATLREQACRGDAASDVVAAWMTSRLPAARP